MDQGLKERLVGAAVLVAIAVWLIPWVLDGPENGVEPRGSSLTLPVAEEPMPMRTQTLRLRDAPEASVAAPAAPARVEPSPAAVAVESRVAGDAATSETELRSEPEAKVAPATLAASRPDGERTAPAVATAPPRSVPAAAPAGDWVVQLGSFADEANARRVAQRAGTFGYTADVSGISSGGRTLYRVRVGPQRTRAEADAAASALRAHGLGDARVVAAR